MIDMKCIECGKEVELTTKTYVANLKNCVIIIKHVPAYVCDCGEVYYDDETAQRIEDIVYSLKKVINDIAVVEYSKAA